jgi:DNA-binding CsgD family transcriptional regulator
MAFAHHQTLRDLKDKLDSVRARLGRLTPRERQVFDLVVGGNTNRQIGRELGATERTIKAHRHRVMEKMQVRTLAELVSLAERIGHLGPADRLAPHSPIGTKRADFLSATGCRRTVKDVEKSESRFSSR